jgi:signal transduction histidine kinase
VLVNLLQNALEATPPGGRVHLSTTHLEDDAARITIRDSGAGLAVEIGDRLFSPGATTKSEGTGLGLTIARAIAEQHGGTLTLTSHENGGCQAKLTLPAKPADEQQKDRGTRP